MDDCYDIADPESDYFGIDPFEINPGVNEIVGDAVDNNCDDDFEEIELDTTNDSYDADGDSVLSVSAPGVLENDSIPFYTEVYQ